MGPFDSVESLPDRSEASTRHMYKGHTYVPSYLIVLDLGMLGSIWWGCGGIPCQVYPAPRVVTLASGVPAFRTWTKPNKKPYLSEYV